MHQLVDPGEEQMGLVAPVSLQGSARLGFMLLQTIAVTGDLGWRQHGNGEIVAVAAKGLDGGIGEHL
jgi:hypothetical protein